MDQKRVAIIAERIAGNLLLTYRIRDGGTTKILEVRAQTSGAATVGEAKTGAQVVSSTVKGVANSLDRSGVIAYNKAIYIAGDDSELIPSGAGTDVAATVMFTRAQFDEPALLGTLKKLKVYKGV